MEQLYLQQMEKNRLHTKALHDFRKLQRKETTFLGGLFYCPPPKSDENKEYPKESKTAIV